jgi:flagellar motility protein MotE (MotC chaperone)
MTRGLRLVDAVVIAAVALLALKVLGVFSGNLARPPTREAAPGMAAAEQRPQFARVLAHARTNYVVPDVEVTAATDIPGASAGEAAKEAGPATPQQPLEKPGAKTAEGAPRPVSPSERAILERLGERRDELQQRSREVDVRERLIENAERKLEARLNELKALEEKSEAAAAKRGDTEAGALRNLVTMYEAMKPKDAARVFDRLPHEVLVPVVLRMKPAKMAEVLAAMSPETAEKLTVALANRAKSLSAETRAPAPSLPPNELPAIEPPSPRAEALPR